MKYPVLAILSVCCLNNLSGQPTVSKKVISDTNCKCHILLGEEKDTAKSVGIFNVKVGDTLQELKLSRCCPKGCRLIHFEIVIYVNKIRENFVSNNQEFTRQMKRILSTSISGTTITVTNIKVTTPSGETKILPERIIQIK